MSVDGSQASAVNKDPTGDSDVQQNVGTTGLIRSLLEVGETTSSSGNL